ncbi:class I adenylate-forming enzyme family protein [Conexibacter woesei]|uniref:AMP-dependent synthetase and ligase n=1 Tax=Conexibacter woesei (strain DSM 14684 / CCUG 47730 / CIP 108061 / JCM 11494 / NBRC 100937 / ID131577) TaxID=469383 RepID=D3F5K0_CONWI|nr:class I adenylate-forming enzyme family protein [Conexibacter woesei]ADB50667.1 AMP-dependent synthetase and ligase [Conexibacter woesei DSM 14684]
MTTRLPRITDYVDHWAHARPEREALVGDDVRLTYGQLRGEVDRCAAALVAGGVRHGDRVALLGDPRPESLVVFLATASVGGIWVGLNPKYTTGELAHVVRDSEPVVLFGMLDPGDAAHAEKLRELSELAPMRVVTRGRALQGLSTAYGDFADVDLGALGPQLERARAAVGPLDPAAMIYTSGSTGTPKGALVPHGGLAFCGSVQAGRWYGDAPRKLCDLPINHIGGLGDICTSVLAAGGTTVFMERFDAAGALRTVERERLTHLYCIPTQLLAAVRTPEWESCDLSSLEWILWGGAAAPLRLLETLAATGARLGTSYSLTESTGSVTYTDEGDPLELLAWSVGRVDPHYEVTLRREDGTTARAGESGEILVRGDFITRGYFRRPQETRAAIDADGWLHTGDLAQEEAGGHVRLVGRLKEMFKSGGYNVYPREIETALEAHPAVALAAVVGVPDERWGEVGHAYVTTRADVSAQELERFAKTRLANYKVPKAFWLESELPKLPIGKVDKVELRRRAAAAG